MDVWQEKLTLRYGNVDRSDRLTLEGTLSFFQEAAISHAAIIGVGRDAMTANAQAWVLSRLSVFIEKRPKYGDNLIVRSWPRGPEKLFCLRDYDIAYESSGKTLVRARSGWLVLDMEKRRPLRIQAIADKIPLNDGLNALLSGPLGLEAREDLVSVGKHLAAYSDIDYYGHVNNVRYVRWIQDITPPELLDKAEQIRLDINYLSETLPGEEVELLSSSITHPGANSNEYSRDYLKDYPSNLSSAFAYEGRKQEGQCVFRAELIFGF